MTNLLLNRDLLAQLYPSFAEGANPLFTLNWSKYAKFLSFRGGLDPITGGLWLSDIAHHYLTIAILFLVVGHIYRTNWGYWSWIKDIFWRLTRAHNLLRNEVHGTGCPTPTRRPHYYYLQFSVRGGRPSPQATSPHARSGNKSNWADTTLRRTDRPGLLQARGPCAIFPD